MYWKPFRGRGWCAIAEPSEYDGTNDDVLEMYMIHEQCLIHLINLQEQPVILDAHSSIE